MKKVFLAITAIIISAGVFAQATTVKDANAVERKVGGFTGVKVSSGIELLIQQGDNDAVAVSCNKPEHLGKIKTEVDGGVLKIYIDNNGWDWKWRNNTKFKAYVSVKEINKLVASSGADVKVSGVINFNQLVVDVSSGAILTGSFKGREMKVDNSSGAISNLSGSVEELSVDASSGAIFRGFDLSSVNCKADASSGGSVKITVTKELSVDASSGGLVQYKGGGVIRNLKTSSGGSVKSSSK